jgi:reprolysin-like metallo-peptidase family M12B
MPYRNAPRLLMLASLLGPGIANCQGPTRSTDAVWTRLDVTGIQTQEFNPGANTSGLFSAFSLNQEKIGGILKAAPREFTQEAKNTTTVVSIPFPDGTFQQFRIEESPVIKTPLESAGSETRTYKGIGIDDPAATIRFETAFDGFHGMVRSAAGVFYIDPPSKDASQNSKGAYLSYFSSARPSPPRRLHCEVSGERAKRDRQRNSARARPAPQPAIAQAFANAPSVLRVYRLALAANSFYVDAVYDKSLPASPFDQAAAAITRTINRVNEIYESEYGIQLNLVDDEAKLIYTNSNTDPYRTVNSDGNAAIAANQKNVDTVIGNNNYDIGHLFSTDTAGLASVGSVCNAAYKAQGVTGISTPSGDPFDVDYVSHEIGHQFGANHTFNTISGSCKGNRYAFTAYEPGSGSTIMGYAGPRICDPYSLQDHSDAYFHIASLIEVQDYINDTTPGNGGSCATLKPLAFAPPSLATLGTYTIPKGTPFLLSGNTADTPSSKYTFTWEEFDLGDPAPPDDENGQNATIRPLFRSRPSGIAAVRFFPDFSNLMGAPGSSDLGEALPMLDRTMKFRLTARNNHGSFAYSDVSVKVDGHSGPFKILPNSEGKTWQKGSVHNLKWDVALTDNPPVSCSHLRIELAVDEDQSRIFTLAQGIPNSGSYDLTIPQATPITSRARLILKSEDNIFLAVSPFVIQITPKN